MQQVRKIADGRQRAIGNRPRVVEQGLGQTGRLDTSLRQRELDLDRQEHLPDLVVQLARDSAPLLFLRAHQLRRQPLKILGGLQFLGSSALEVTLQTADVCRRKHRDAQGRQDGEAERLRDAALGLW
jgi:hypothetical protein